MSLAQGDITEQDIVNDAAIAGFDIFDVDFDDERTARKIGFGMHMDEDLKLEAR